MDITHTQSNSCLSNALASTLLFLDFQWTRIMDKPDRFCLCLDEGLQVVPDLPWSTFVCNRCRRELSPETLSTIFPAIVEPYTTKDMIHPVLVIPLVLVLHYFLLLFGFWLGGWF